MRMIPQLAVTVTGANERPAGGVYGTFGLHYRKARKD
jgi:hypothetical protein